ncbi:MAG: hypothetical protein K6T72_14380 [Anoxybacillus sp.]|nr:hypothetical protein [Anoxybacillus sp.]MCL6587672.1 hypothetical protein [Anoxybacillus sp.]
MLDSFFKVERNGQIAIDFDLLFEAGISVDVVKEQIEFVSSSRKFTLDGFFVDRNRRSFVIVYSAFASNTGALLSTCIVVPFQSSDYYVLPFEFYFSGGVNDGEKSC